MSDGYTPPDNPRQIISHALAEYCDKLLPEQARKIIQVLGDHGYEIVKVRHTTRKPFDFAEVEQPVGGDR